MSSRRHEPQRQPTSHVGDAARGSASAPHAKQLRRRLSIGIGLELPRRNVELKAHDSDPETSRQTCLSLGAKDRGEIAQRDTYFAVTSGGLKLREEHPGLAHLIQYERASEPQQRESRYRIINVSEPEMMIEVLAASIGVRGIVVKRRRLLLWQSVRIHLDEVERLGSFIELEAVAPASSDLAHEYELIAELREALAISDERLVSLGYADQLL